MSDRLPTLLDAIWRALYGQSSAGFSPAHELIVSGWLLTLQEEIAERDAKPATREEALADILGDLNFITTAEQVLGPRANEHIVEDVRKVAAKVERMAFGKLPNADFGTLVEVALDYRQARGEDVTPGLAKRIAGLLPALLEHEAVRKVVESAYAPWTGNIYAWWCDAYDGGDVQVTPTRPENDRWTWEIRDADGDTIADGEAPTLADAMRAADEALRADGRILIGGIPDEVLEQERFREVTRAAVDAVEGSDAPIAWEEQGERPAVDVPPYGCPHCKDTGIQWAGAEPYECGWCEENSERTPTEEEGRLDDEDGDTCAECGASIDGPASASKVRIVAGEEARVCAGCAEDIDNAPDGSEGAWP